MLVTKVNNKDQLKQILILQDRYHYESLSLDSKLKNGFVTVRHTLTVLEEMQESAPQVIALDNNRVVAYALVMLPQIKNRIPILLPLFKSLEYLSYQGKKITDYSYYVMGQICIEKDYRGTGLFKKLYTKHKEYYATTYQLLITEVATSNIPSMKAHLKIGFEVLHTHTDNQDTWNVLLWNWNETNKN